MPRKFLQEGGKEEKKRKSTPSKGKRRRHEPPPNPVREREGRRTNKKGFLPRGSGRTSGSYPFKGVKKTRLGVDPDIPLRNQEDTSGAGGEPR